MISSYGNNRNVWLFTQYNTNKHLINWQSMTASIFANYSYSEWAERKHHLNNKLFSYWFQSFQCCSTLVSKLLIPWKVTFKTISLWQELNNTETFGIYLTRTVWNKCILLWTLRNILICGTFLVIKWLKKHWNFISNIYDYE